MYSSCLPGLRHFVLEPYLVWPSRQQAPLSRGQCTMGDEAGSYGQGTTAGPNDAKILGALGTLVGTEISVGDLFERLLRPQRFYIGLSAKSIWKLGFLMPMGGPLHNACKRTLDSFYHKGLFKGGKLGHMLGTAFFSDTERLYQVHEPNASPKREHVRNGL